MCEQSWHSTQCILVWYVEVQAASPPRSKDQWEAKEVQTNVGLFYAIAAVPHSQRHLCEGGANNSRRLICQATDVYLHECIYIYTDIYKVLLI